MPADQVASTTKPRSDVTIIRDKATGVPHITGTTRSGTEFGAGYAAAQDRLLLMDVLRHVGRGQLTPFAGGAAANQELEQDFFATPRTPRTSCSSRSTRVAASGPRGAQAMADAQAYIDGINQYITDSYSGRYFPGEYDLTGHIDPITNAGTIDPFKLTDLVAIASRGRRPVRRRRRRRGAGRASRSSPCRRSTASSRARRSGESCGRGRPRGRHTLHDGQSFPYGKTPANPQGMAMPDPGSVTPQQLVFDQTGSAVDRDASHSGRRSATARAGSPPRKGMFNDGVLPGDMLKHKHGMSNALVVSGAHTASGHPVAVFGPQTGYFAPQLLMLEELQGPGISARGASFAGHQLLRAARPRPGLLVERDDVQPGHHRHLRGRPVRPERRTGHEGLELLPVQRPVRADADRGAQGLLEAVAGRRSRAARTRCAPTGPSTGR